MKTFLIALTALTPIVTPSISQAQGRTCGDRTAIVERLQTGFGEARTGAGLSTQNGVVEIFASEETGTWTIILTLPSGKSCLVAAGNSWESGPTEVTKSGLPV